jgi:hypothetical protein
MALTSGALKRARVRWEQVSLAAQAGLLGFSSCLRHAAHRGSQASREPGALPAGRQDLKPQDMWRTGALPAGLKLWYTWWR